MEAYSMNGAGPLPFRCFFPWLLTSIALTCAVGHIDPMRYSAHQTMTCHGHVTGSINLCCLRAIPANELIKITLHVLHIRSGLLRCIKKNIVSPSLIMNKTRSGSLCGLPDLICHGSDSGRVVITRANLSSFIRECRCTN